jgi:hypothetical protein
LIVEKRLETASWDVKAEAKKMYALQVGREIVDD